MPLQLSSMVLQISPVGVPGTHEGTAPRRQPATVRRHAPTPQVMSGTASSMSALQLLSRPSQTSEVVQAEQVPLPSQMPLIGGDQRNDVPAATTFAWLTPTRS